MPNLELIDYSEKSFVIRGPDTKEYKEYLKSEGGRFNPALIDPITKMKFAGWIFPMAKKDYIRHTLEEYSLVDLNHGLKKETSKMEPIVNHQEILLPEQIKTISKPIMKREAIDESKKNMQEIVFDIEYPYVGQICVIYCGDKEIMGKVVSLNQQNNIVMDFVVRVDEQDFPRIYHVVLGFQCWRILGTLVEHKIELL